MQVIGILGGTFNPVHLGHRYIAQQALSQLQLQQLRWLPAAIPALKDAPAISPEHRVSMLQLAIASLPDEQQQKMQIDLREIHRGGVSYSIQTLESFREELGWQCSLIWLIGSDAFAQIEQWHEWQRLLDYTHFAVIARPQSIQQYTGVSADLLRQHGCQQVGDLHESSHGKIFCMDIQAPDIASRVIRQHVQQGLGIEHLVGNAVAGYIAQHHLYQA